MLTESPARGITFTAKDDGRDTRLPFTIGDARLILIAARKSDDPVIRWSNWIAAYTSARLQEIVGSTKEDTKQINGYCCIDISLENRADDATLKNVGSKRLVPLHPAVLNEGFLNYVGSLR